jgi:hypothetical protein
MKIYNNKQKNICQIIPSDFFNKYTDITTREQKELAYFNIEIAGKMFGMFISER